MNSFTRTYSTLWSLSGLVLLALATGACGGVDDYNDTEAETEDALAFFNGASPTTVTFFSEAGFWGTRLSVQMQPTGAEEVTRVVTKGQIEGANLLRRISSIRIQCGGRASQIAIFQSWNLWSEFATTAKPYYCNPGETVSINLHNDAPAFADRVGSVYMVTHGRAHNSVAFSTFLTNAWTAQLDNLPSGAEASGPVRLWLRSKSTFRLRQNLRLDDWRCGERGGILELQARILADGTFSVIVVSTYVDTGWGDAWGCRSRMQSGLASGATTAAGDLRNGLNQLRQLVGTHPRYYFTPTWSIREFELSGGGTPAPNLMVRARLAR